jgi:hypothetical protein
MAKKIASPTVTKQPVAKQQDILGVKMVTIRNRIVRQLPVRRDTNYTLAALAQDLTVVVGWINALEALGWMYMSQAVIVRIDGRLEVWDVGLEWFDKHRDEFPQILVD